MGYTTITPGTTIASDWGNEVRDQLVTPFASTGARSSAITTPVSGMVSTLTTASTANGIEIHNGTTWRKPWNLPWGFISAPAPSVVTFGTAGANSGTFTVNVIANRYYRVSLTGEYANGAATGTIATVWVSNTGGANMVGNLLSFTPAGASSVFGGGAVGYYNSTATAALSWRISASSSLNNSSQTFTTRAMIIEDMGPSGAPS